MDVNNLCMKCMNQSIIDDICKECGTPVNFTQEPPSALPLQTILNGKYIVGAVIGHGGFGITYIAWDLEKNRKVAIKEYMPEGMATRTPGTTMVSVYSGSGSGNYAYGMNKFLEEARTIYTYRESSNIIHVFELFEENSTAYYVMEYLEGSDLKEYLKKRGGKIDYTEALKIVRPVFQALKIIHKDSLIHRDISPDNIYIARNGDIKLLDFGAARIALGEKSQNLSVILKRGYAPEEQYRERGKQGSWTDVYAMGATLYQMITGELPPQSTDRVFEDTIIPPQRICRNLLPHVNNAILKSLAVRAADRFHTIAEFEAALDNKLKVENFIPPVAAGTENNFAPQPSNAPVGYNSNYSPAYPQNRVASSLQKANLQGTSGTYAGFWKRAAASVLDAIMLNIAGGIIIYSMGQDAGYLVYLLLGILYFSLMESSSYQATLGKMALGIIVVDEGGNRISSGKAFGRYFGKAISALAIGIGFIMAGFTEKKQALHDMMANTYVVNRTPGFSNVPSYNNVSNRAYAPAQQVNSIPVFNANKVSLKALSGYYRDTSFPIGDSPILIGRDFNICQIVFPQDAPGVSAIHCEVHLDAQANALILIDKGSSHGTYLADGRKLNSYEAVSLKAGDSFTIGDNNKFIFLMC